MIQSTLVSATPHLESCTFRNLIIMRHLEPRSLEPTLNIEPLIGLTTVQYALITTRLLSNEVQRLDNLQPELLPLLVLRDSDIFDVSDYAQVMDTVFALVSLASQIQVVRGRRLTTSSPRSKPRFQQSSSRHQRPAGSTRPFLVCSSNRIAQPIAPL